MAVPQQFQFFFLASIVAYATALSSVNKISPCKVQTDQGIMDFSSLAGTQTNPKFVNIQSSATNTRTYDWNPCIDFDEPQEKMSQNCKGVAMCRLDNVIGKRSIDIPKISARRPFETIFLGMGTQSSTGFIVNPQGHLELQFGDSTQGILVHVVLVCASGDDTFTCIDDASDALNPVFQLSGSHECFVPVPPSQGSPISTGSILCIVFFVALFLYAVGGVLFMKYRTGAHGVEMIPNVTFWRAIPVHCKNGVLFVKSGFRSQAVTYDNI